MGFGFHALLVQNALTEGFKRARHGADLVATGNGLDLDVVFTAVQAFHQPRKAGQRLGQARGNENADQRHDRKYGQCRDRRPEGEIVGGGENLAFLLADGQKMFLSEDGDRAIGIEDVARRCLRHHRSGVVCVGKGGEALGNGSISAAREYAGPTFAVGAQENGVIDGLAGFLGRYHRADAIGGDAHDDGALALVPGPSWRRRAACRSWPNHFRRR